MAEMPYAADGDASGSWPSLLLTCALMFLGAYGCGMLPRWLPDQQRFTSTVSSVGAGLLLGSALCIILPEGFEAAMEVGVAVSVAATDQRCLAWAFVVVARQQQEAAASAGRVHRGPAAAQACR